MTDGDPDTQPRDVLVTEFFASAEHVMLDGPRDIGLVFIGDSFIAGYGDPKGLGWVNRVVGRTGHPDDQACGRDDAVVRAEHPGAQPVQSLRKRLDRRSGANHSDRHESIVFGKTPCRKLGEAFLSAADERKSESGVPNCS